MLPYEAKQGSSDLPCISCFKTKFRIFYGSWIEILTFEIKWLLKY